MLLFLFLFLSTEVTDTVYKYNGVSFEHFQDIPGAGTNEIETVAIGDDTFLVVANSNNSVSQGISTIYIYNQDTGQFDQHQDISVGGKIKMNFR